MHQVSIATQTVDSRLNIAAPGFDVPFMAWMPHGNLCGSWHGCHMEIFAVHGMDATWKSLRFG